MAASGGNGSGGSSGEFAGSTLPELQAWLESSGINTSAYGKAASKSMDLLWEEASLLPLWAAGCEGTVQPIWVVACGQQAS